MMENVDFVKAPTQGIPDLCIFFSFFENVATQHQEWVLRRFRMASLPHLHVAEYKCRLGEKKYRIEM
jgi:hypothetical protein